MVESGELRVRREAIGVRVPCGIISKTPARSAHSFFPAKRQTLNIQLSTINFPGAV
jgi:hypothetical protein